MATENLTLNGEMSRLYDALAVLAGAKALINHDEQPDVYRMVRMAEDMVNQTISNLDEIELQAAMLLKKTSTTAPWDSSAKQ